MSTLDAPVVVDGTADYWPVPGAALSLVVGPVLCVVPRLEDS
jgi:hypothetical protein